MFDIKGKVALVTGGASGIGLSFTKELLKNGCIGVTIVDINEEKGNLEKTNLNKKFGENKVVFVKANVAEKSELREAFQNTIDVFKQIDIVFNNAGVSHEIRYEICIDVNLKGVVHCLKLAIDEYLPKYKSSKESLIINTASVVGLIRCDGVEIYSATKAGVVALTRNFGSDFHYQRTGVRVIAICPDSTDTDMMNGDRVTSGLAYTELAQSIEEACKRKKQQTADQLVQATTRILKNAENGSIWYIGDGKETKVNFPDLLQNIDCA